MNPTRTIAAAVLALVGSAVWWRKHPSACPYGQRFWVAAPHPLITHARLRDALVPQPGETILEVGPGTGYFTLPVARWLGDSGALHIFDVQQQMLEHASRRAAENGITNIRATRGDARRLPFGDGTFDAAFLVAVLGEIPDQDVALRELRRVIKPDGRIVVGELMGDPHFVTAGSLQRRAAAAGLELERHVGPRFGYFGVLRCDGAGAS